MNNVEHTIVWVDGALLFFAIIHITVVHTDIAYKGRKSAAAEYINRLP